MAHQKGLIILKDAPMVVKFFNFLSLFNNMATQKAENDK